MELTGEQLKKAEIRLERYLPESLNVCPVRPTRIQLNFSYNTFYSLLQIDYYYQPMISFVCLTIPLNILIILWTD